MILKSFIPIVKFTDDSGNEILVESKVTKLRIIKNDGTEVSGLVYYLHADRLVLNNMDGEEILFIAIKEVYLI